MKLILGQLVPDNSPGPRPGPRSGPRPPILDDELQPAPLELVIIVLLDGVLHVTL